MKTCTTSARAARGTARSYGLSVNLRPHRGADGRVLGYFSCALEVNELKRTHDALSRALQHLASHIENTPLAVIEWSSNIGIMRWSPQAHAIFGWRAEEVLGKKSIDFGLFHEESLPIVRALTKELLSGVVPRNRMLARNHTKDGSTIWCQWYNSAVFDEQGKIASILSLAEDVTARVDGGGSSFARRPVHDSLTRAAQPQLARTPAGARHHAREPHAETGWPFSSSTSTAFKK